MTADDAKAPGSRYHRGLAGRFAYFTMNRAHRSIYRNVARVAELAPDDDLLDIACGNGYFLKKYATHVRSIAGLDVHEPAIGLAVRNNHERVALGSAEFRCGDASQLPWDGDRFSVVTVMGSFPFFPEPLAMLEEVRRVLRPGGRAVFSIEWNAEEPKDRSKKAVKHGVKILAERDVRGLLEEAGFSEVSVTYGKGFTMPKIMLATAVK